VQFSCLLLLPSGVAVLINRQGCSWGFNHVRFVPSVTVATSAIMRPILAMLPLLLAFGLSDAHPLPHPQILTESEFRSLRDDATPNNKVAIIDGYANIRRQGRMLGGETIDFKRPLPVRVSFSGRGRQLFADSTARHKKFTRMDVGPVFNLEDMLRKEAAKLKAQIQEASLKAAKAAEEAEKKLEDMVKAVRADATHEEVETIIEEAIESGIEEAEAIVEEELKEAADLEDQLIEDEDEDDEEDNEVIEVEQDDEEEMEADSSSKSADKEQLEPSGEIDLGSVQEV